MIYCPVCNLHGVSEDHAINFHGVQRANTFSDDRTYPLDMPKFSIRALS